MFEQEEQQTAPETKQQTAPEAKPKKEKNPKKNAAEKHEARKTLMQLLLIVLVIAGIVYLGLNIVTGGIGLVLFVLSYIWGVA